MIKKKDLHTIKISVKIDSYLKLNNSFTFKFTASERPKVEEVVMIILD